jgi:5,6-dimethylbenzimidazole synthase
MDLIRLSPSVGLSEPWRFVRVSSPEKRIAIRNEFEKANAEALSGYEGEQQRLYSRLKLAGLNAAPIQLAVFADRSTDKGSGLGRRTMPEMIEYSVVSAITILWLAARTYGIGMGWISILDPVRVSAIVGAPDTWRLVAYLCLGYPEVETTRPELEQAGWESRSAGPVTIPEI